MLSPENVRKLLFGKSTFQSIALTPVREMRVSWFVFRCWNVLSLFFQLCPAWWSRPCKLHSLPSRSDTRGRTRPEVAVSRGAFGGKRHFYSKRRHELVHLLTLVIFSHSSISEEKKKKKTYLFCINISGFILAMSSSCYVWDMPFNETLIKMCKNVSLSQTRTLGASS